MRYLLLLFLTSVAFNVYAQTGNTNFGTSSLSSNTTGGYNSAFGENSLPSNTTGTANNALGWGALFSNTTGSYNTAVGYTNLGYNTTGDWNTGLGDRCLFSNTTGSGNTAVGHFSGFSNTSGINNTFFGANSGGSTFTAENQTAIGFGASGQADNSVVLGNDDVTAVYMAEDRGAKIYAGEGDFSGDIVTAGNITVSSDIRLKKDIVNLPSTIDNIKSLRPVSYSKKNSLNSEEYGSTEVGFIAQELQEVYPDMVSEDESEDSLLSVSYLELIPVLIKAIQEQQVMIERQQKQIESLENVITSKE